MKNKIYFVNFMFFFLIFSNTLLIVNAFDYGVGVHKDQEIIWKCNFCNEVEMNNIFGNEWDDSGVFKNLSIGKHMKWKINSVEINQSLSRINISIWEWTSKKVWGPQDNNSEITYFFDSTESNFTMYRSLVPFWFPVPVGEFMGNLNLNKWYDVDNRVLPTLNVEIGKDAISLGFPQKDIKIIAIYNDQGILNSYKLYSTGNVVVIDIALDFLPFYVVPTLIGLIIGLSLSLGLFIYKKRKSRSN
ncbi:MAG: hypothetical protein ACFFDF_25405 [Candidatus Odinarchaeota archaeon]